MRYNLLEIPVDTKRYSVDTAIKWPPESILYTFCFQCCKTSEGRFSRHDLELQSGRHWWPLAGLSLLIRLVSISMGTCSTHCIHKENVSSDINGNHSRNSIDNANESVDSMISGATGSDYDSEAVPLLKRSASSPKF